MAGQSNEGVYYVEGIELVSQILGATLLVRELLLWLMQSFGCLRPACECAVTQSTCELSQLDACEQSDLLTSAGCDVREIYLN